MALKIKVFTPYSPSIDSESKQSAHTRVNDFRGKPIHTTCTRLSIVILHNIIKLHMEIVRPGYYLNQTTI